MIGVSERSSECGEELIMQHYRLVHRDLLCGMYQYTVFIPLKLSPKIKALTGKVWDCCYKTFVIPFEIKFIH